MDILSKLIIFLIRMKLHLRKGEQFQFSGSRRKPEYDRRGHEAAS